jgi:hypothetical protein
MRVADAITAETGKPCNALISASERTAVGAQSASLGVELR